MAARRLAPRPDESATRLAGVDEDDVPDAVDDEGSARESVSDSAFRVYEREERERTGSADTSGVPGRKGASLTPDEEFEIERWANSAVAELRTGASIRDAIGSANADQDEPNLDEEPSLDLFGGSASKLWARAPHSLVDDAIAQAKASEGASRPPTAPSPGRKVGGAMANKHAQLKAERRDFETPTGESRQPTTAAADVDPGEEIGAGTPRAGTPAAAPGGGRSASPPRPAPSAVSRRPTTARRDCGATPQPLPRDPASSSVASRPRKNSTEPPTMPHAKNGAHDELRDQAHTHLLKHGPMPLAQLAEAVKPKAMTMGAFRGALVVGQRAGLLQTTGHAAGARWSAVGGGEPRVSATKPETIASVVAKHVRPARPSAKVQVPASPALIPAPPEGVDAELAGPLLAKREGHVRAIAKIDALLLSLADL